MHVYIFHTWYKLSDSEVLSRFEQHLQILSSTATQIKWALSPIAKRDTDEELKFILTHHALILLVGFLEEWKGLEALDEKNQEESLGTPPPFFISLSSNL